MTHYGSSLTRSGSPIVSPQKGHLTFPSETFSAGTHCSLPTYVQNDDGSSRLLTTLCGTLSCIPVSFRNVFFPFFIMDQGAGIFQTDGTLESLRASERVNAVETSTVKERATELRAPKAVERAVIHGTPKYQERAKCPETPIGHERVKDHESSILGERAIGRETPVEHERVRVDESSMTLERAIVGEKSKYQKRAKRRERDATETE